MSDKKTIWRTIIQTLITILTAIGTTLGVNAAVYYSREGHVPSLLFTFPPDNSDNSDSVYRPLLLVILAIHPSVSLPLLTQVLYPNLTNLWIAAQGHDVAS